MAMAALLLMTGAAQARPLIILGWMPHSNGTQASSSQTPLDHVDRTNAGLPAIRPIPHAKVNRTTTVVTPAIRPIPHRPVGTATGLTSFDWTDAALGAGSVLVLALCAGTGAAARGRRRTALSH